MQSISLSAVGTLILLIAVWIPEIPCRYLERDLALSNPCKVAKQRKLSNKYPVMRVIDENNEETADVLLGDGRGLLGTLILQKSLQKNVVVECSSSSGPVEWTYEGKGASSGLKIVPTVWASSSRSLKVGCYSAALVIMNVTDQLTGKYSCRNPSRPESSHSFMLYVPYQHPFYHSEGETVNISLPTWSDHMTLDPIVIPCISKQRSRAGISLYRIRENEEVKVELGPHVKYDPFIGFELFPSSQFSPYFQKDSSITKFTCKFDNNLPAYPDIMNKTLLNVNLIIQSEEKLTPVKSSVRSSSPYFSWTTKNRPTIEYHISQANASSEEDGSLTPHEIYWQQLFVKNDYEEYSNSSPIYHLGSLQLLNLREGVTGTVQLHQQNATRNLTHEWSFEILNTGDEHLSGLTYEVIDGLHIFTCISATKMFPSIKVKNMSTDEIDHSSNNDTSGFIVDKCPQDSVLGCLILTTMIPIGEVTCEGDGVDRTIRFPLQPFEPSAPFFIERGDTIVVKNQSNSSTTNIPCLTNSPYADFKIYLFKMGPDNTTWGKIWPAQNETSEELIQFRSDLGFLIDDNENHIGGSGVYLCTSSADPEDRSDAVIVNVLPLLNSPEETTHETQEQVTKVELKIEKQVVEDGTISGIYLTCQSSSRRTPFLRYFLCPNENTCNLVQACSKKNCNSEHKYKYGNDTSESIELGNASCLETQGCTSIRLKSVPVNGFLKASCSVDGVTEEQSISDVFFREDIHWNTDQGEDLIHLYVNMISSTDQNPQREVQTIGSNIDWQIGASVTFSCIAAPHLFSSGVKWAIEMTDGSLKYQKDNYFEDPQFKYSGPTQILSTFTLSIDSFEIKRIWCFVPTISSPVTWKNISQPIFIRPEVDENCHEMEPSIRLLNMYPPLSKIEMNLSDPRIDNLPYFVVPRGVKQFAVKLTSQKQVEWSFVGFGSGPSRTPLIETKRIITDFYDASSYCYTSKLLINLRHRNSNDTGRYIARFKDHSESSEITLSFYLFVPGAGNEARLLRSGTEINETLTEDASSFVLPCLVNDPTTAVQLFRRDETTGDYEEVEVDDESISYNPTVGFTFFTTANDNDYLLGSYKCAVNNSISDYLLVNVIPRPEKTGELKFEKVGELNIFKCLSSTNLAPKIEFIEESSNSSYMKSQSDEETLYKTKECPGGCLLLMTSAISGKVHCTGDGINETMTIPSYFLNSANNESEKLGLWHDKEKNVFVCKTKSQASPKLTAVMCRRPSECKVMQNAIQQEGDTTQAISSPCGIGCSQLEVKPNIRLDWPANYFSIFIRCKGGNNVDIFSQYFYEKNETIPVSISSAEQFKELRMDVISFRKEGKSIQGTFRCFANRYFYSKGIRWALMKHNGALIHHDSFREVEVQKFSSTMSEAILDFDANKFRSVYCFVPLLESSKWSNTSIKLPLERLISPFEQY